MVSHLLQGTNDAERILRGGSQTNTGNQMNWVSNTDNRGRAHHAEGDSVSACDDDREHHGFGKIVGGIGRTIGKGVKTVGKAAGKVAGAVLPYAGPVLAKAAMTMLAKGGRVDDGREHDAGGGNAGWQQHAGGGGIGWQQHADGGTPGEIGQPSMSNQMSQQSPQNSTVEQQNQLAGGGRPHYGLFAPPARMVRRQATSGFSRPPVDGE